MQFASFTLIFLFLPITMLLFYLTPNRWKREVMLGISLLFLCSGGWLAAAVEILLTALTYGAGLPAGTSAAAKTPFQTGFDRQYPAALRGTAAVAK